MLKKICLLLLLCNILVVAQDNEKILFSFADKEVSKSEFVHVYKKHNSQEGDMFTQQSVDEYLELYINFKLKVHEAEQMGLDTVPAIVAQLEEYYKQLAKSYLYDKDISDDLIEEAYERMKKEVKTSHILIMVQENALPDDTLKAYNKANSIYRLLTEREESFERLAQKYSQDPSVQDNKGNLGYITAFQTVYPFESAAYNTPVGQISKPVRTQYGYHLIKVDDVRPAQGKVQVAHILLRTSEEDTEAKSQALEKRVNDLYKKARKGKILFADLVLANSEDKTTATKGGELPMFSTGKMLPEFEAAAFSLKKVGEVSKPFKTKLGWHIVKLLDKEEVGDLDDALKADIKRKIERDERARISEQMFMNRLKFDYQFTENINVLKAFTDLVNQSVQVGRWTTDSITTNFDYKQRLFFVVKRNQRIDYSIGQFADFLEKNQLRGRSRTISLTVANAYKLFVDKVLLDIEEEMLQYRNPDFARLMKEFRDGNLLYELMSQKVWSKAMEDTAGLKQYFKNNEDKYQWNERADAHILTFSNKEDAEAIKQLLVKTDKASMLAFEKEAKSGKMSKAKVESGLFEKNQRDLFNAVDWQPGTFYDIGNPDGSISMVVIHEIQPPRAKQMDEARGYIIADYQNQLEQKWISQLRKKYPIRVDATVLKSIYKK